MIEAVKIDDLFESGESGDAAAADAAAADTAAADAAAAPAATGDETVDVESDDGVLRLSGGLNLAATSQLVEDLLRRRGSDLAIDMSAVDHVSAPCIEALLAAAKTWRVDGRALALSATSEAVDGCLALLGLNSDDFYSEARKSDDA